MENIYSRSVYKTFFPIFIFTERWLKTHQFVYLSISPYGSFNSCIMYFEIMIIGTHKLKIVKCS